MGIFSTDAAGQDAVNLFGHKIPVSMLGVAAAALGALLVLHARNSGGSVVSAGTSSTATPTYSSTSYDPDAQAIADLQAQVAQLGSTTSSVSDSSPSGSATSTPTYGPTSGGAYSPLGSYSAVQAAANAGETVYYQPGGPGTPYVAVPDSQIYPGSGYGQTYIWSPTSATPATTSVPANPTPASNAGLLGLSPPDVPTPLKPAPAPGLTGPASPLLGTPVQITGPPPAR
jgi:hypothetical protein